MALVVGGLVVTGLAAVMAMVAVVAAGAGRPGLIGGSGGTALGWSFTAVSLVLAGAATGWACAERRRWRSAVRSAADQARSLDLVRDRALAGFEALERTPRASAAGPAFRRDTLELRTTTSLVDELVGALVGAAGEAIEARRAEAEAWSATLEQLGWSAYNGAARQLRLLGRLEGSEAVGGTTAPTAPIAWTATGATGTTRTTGTNARSGADPATRSERVEIRRLATEQQRRARSALVLAGARAPGQSALRGHQQGPASLQAVIDRAVDGIDQAWRVRGGPFPLIRVTPAAQADLVHLLSLLLDGVLRRTPRSEPVVVEAEPSTTGVLLRLTTPLSGPGAERPLPTASLTDGWLDRAVAVRLAAAHDLDINLDLHLNLDLSVTSESGRVAAAVRLPAHVLVNETAVPA